MTSLSSLMNNVSPRNKCSRLFLDLRGRPGPRRDSVREPGTIRRLSSSLAPPTLPRPPDRSTRCCMSLQAEQYPRSCANSLCLHPSAFWLRNLSIFISDRNIHAPPLNIIPPPPSRRHQTHSFSFSNNPAAPTSHRQLHGWHRRERTFNLPPINPFLIFAFRYSADVIPE